MGRYQSYEHEVYEYYECDDDGFELACIDDGPGSFDGREEPFSAYAAGVAVDGWHGRGQDAEDDDAGEVFEGVGVFGVEVGASAADSPDVADLSPHDLGIYGEEAAVAYLRMRGYDIVERNWTCPFGEADIIMYDREVCVLVEVKTRLDVGIGRPPLPEQAVTERKRRRYERIAECYLRDHEVEFLRFDVVAVTARSGTFPQIRHYRGAFWCDE